MTMLSHSANQLALRTRLLTLSVVTTGSATLAATTTGYTRASGSFLTDGFYAGMEVVPSGFAVTTPVIVQDVSALLLTIEGGIAAESSGSGRSLAVGLPTYRAWENVKFPSVSARRWYCEENYLPTTLENLGVTPGGTLEDRGLYVVKLLGVANYDVMALSLAADAVSALFPPGYAITANAYVSGESSARRSQLLTMDEGRPFISVTIPWRAHTLNY